MASNVSQDLTLTDHSTVAQHTQTRLPGLISLSTRTIIVDVITCGIEPLPWLLGLGGNFLSLVVLSYQGFKQTTNIFLVGLALSDFLWVVSSSHRLLACVARYTFPQLAADIQIIHLLFLGKLSFVFATISRWYVCFIAFERFIVVQFPLKTSIILTKTRVVVASVAIWIIAFSLSAYTFLLFEAVEVYNPVLNRTLTVIQQSEFQRNNLKYLLPYASFVHPLFISYIPLIVVFVCTVVILLSLRASALQRAELRRSASSSDARQQVQITKMLVGICIVFLFTNIPQIAISVARLLYIEEGYMSGGRYHNIHTVTTSVMLLFNLINSSVNVLFYIIFNQKFRASCIQLFGLCGQKLGPTSKTSVPLK